MKNKIIKLLPWIYLAIAFIISMVFFINNVDHLMDSDESSELILGNLLSKEFGILSKNWYYSTELRVLNNQIVFAILFLFTNSYKAVRILSTIILALIVLASFYYLCKQAGIQKYYPYMAVFFVLPFSVDYAEYILYGLYYVPHMVISFLVVGLILKCERLYKSYKQSDEDNGKSGRTSFYVHLAILALLSLFAGMGGPRQVLILFVPVLVTLVIRLYQTRKIEFISGYVAFVFGAIGYVLNTAVLSKIYTFLSWNSMEFQGFSISRLSDIVEGLFSTVGFRYGAVFSYSLVSNAIVGLYVLCLIMYYVHLCKSKDEISDSERFMALFFVVATVTFILLYDMTNMDYKNRYAIPVLVFGLPLFGFSIEHHGWPKRSVITGCIAILVVNILATIPVFQIEKETETTWSLRGISDYIVENNLTTGFATYWNANILTELTDGQADMYCFGEDAFTGNDITKPLKWLQLVSHDDLNIDGGVFLVMSDEELVDTPFSLYLNKEYAYHYGDLYLWTYDSYESLVCALSEFNVNTYVSDYLVNGESIDGAWHIYDIGVSRGPYTTMYPGAYRITITGSGLEHCSYSATYNLSEFTAELIPESQSDNEMVFMVYPEETYQLFELPIYNPGGGEAVITSFNIDRL